MRAKVICKADRNKGLKQKWEYRGYIIVHSGDSEYDVYKDGAYLHCTTHFVHAKELVDYYIDLNA